MALASYLSVTTMQMHRRSKREPGSRAPQKFPAYLVVLCYERRCPSKYCCSRKVKTFGLSQNLRLAALLPRCNPVNIWPQPQVAVRQFVPLHDRRVRGAPAILFQNLSGDRIDAGASHGLLRLTSSHAVVFSRTPSLPFIDLLTPVENPDDLTARFDVSSFLTPSAASIVSIKLLDDTCAASPILDKLFPDLHFEPAGQLPFPKLELLLSSWLWLRLSHGFRNREAEVIPGYKKLMRPPCMHRAHDMLWCGH